MPDFAYTARNMSGERVTGRIAAGSEREAVALLTGQSLFPMEVVAEKRAASKGKRVRGQIMALTYNQLSSLLRSGVPLLRSLSVLRDQCSHPVLSQVLEDIYSRVEDGSSLAEAMARHPRVFNEMAVSMVRAGGEGGFLEEALERVATFTEEADDLKARTTGALAYPAFLGVVGTIVVSTLIIVFVPQFAKLFDKLRERGELPRMTDYLLGFSDMLRDYGIWLALAAMIAAYVLRQRLNTDEGRRTWDYVKVRVPMIGGIFLDLAVARFCRVLGTLLRNGVPILRSLEISRAAAGNRVLAEAIGKASENISSGASLAAPLASSGYFPKLVVEMITVAEEANTLDTVLVEIADGLEKRTSRRLDLFVRLLEPVMLLIMAGIVLCVVIALLLPVIKMSSSL
ncbi:MAG: type II secretion system F family protein [Planctomycetales bacterium]|nr:type II secretion system F family protein [Planctomycetales bacterium]